MAIKRAILLICAFILPFVVEHAVAITFQSSNANAFLGRPKRGQIPPDILALPDAALVKQKIKKIYDLMPKPILNRAVGSYFDRRRYYLSEQWKKDFKRLEHTIANTSIKRRLAKNDPVVTAAEMLRVAEELIIYGRPLDCGSFNPMPSFSDLAKYYGFWWVENFLRENNALDTKRNDANGMRQAWPEPDEPRMEEFRDFDILAQKVNASEWSELRAEWARQHAKYKELEKARAKKKAKGGRRW